ncbi:hypothetical protein EJ08DRAFT_692089 [Tothia fuscella]|uniref:Uncharacterized protein n=1 Tax=Tothia fuscella TaxID=1048955 RepID=A0A9P4U423_9PEZI|nr:hypothetical protein EJ08DRAFT_692089 [Tothia fuscella]
MEDPFIPAHQPPAPSPRPANFLDDPSDEEASETGATPNAAPDRGRRRSISPRKEETSYLGGATAAEYVSRCQDDDVKTTQVVLPPPQEGYLKLTSTPLPQDPRSPYLRPPPALRGDSSYEGEVASPTATEAQTINFQAPGPGRLIHHSSPRTSAVIDVDEVEPSAAVLAAVESTNEAIKDIHTQTMQALLRNEDHLHAPVNAHGSRVSFIPDDGRPVPHPPIKKRVSMAPPPLDIGPRGSLPDDIVRTPYPFLFRKAMPKPSPLRTSSIIDRESILALSVRRHEVSCKPSKRVSKMTIPANLEATAVKNPNTNEKHFETLDFDDAHFFRELGRTYHNLAGPFRFFSARTLQRIDLSHSVTCGDPYVVDYGMSRAGALCTHDYPRSPRFLASRGLTDSFSSVELMKHYSNPKLGKARYAWVHWAHRISNIAPHLRSPAPPPTGSSAGRFSTTSKDNTEYAGLGIRDEDDCSAGLEFVEGWCLWRILVAVSGVLVCAIAAALCWILLGTQVSLSRSGYRDSGERVVGGMMIGVFVLLVGWTGVTGWIGLSWLID